MVGSAFQHIPRKKNSRQSKNKMAAISIDIQSLTQKVFKISSPNFKSFCIVTYGGLVLYLSKFEKKHGHQNKNKMAATSVTSDQ